MPRIAPCSRCNKPLQTGRGSKPNPTCLPCKKVIEDQRQALLMPRVCKACGKDFYAERRGAKCSQCRYAQAKERAVAADKMCPDCGKPATHAEYCGTHYTRRYRGERGQISNRFWIKDADRQAIYNRDNWECQICGEEVERTFTHTPKSPTLDHIIPRSHGGGDETSNLRLACWSCNSSRGNRAA